MTDEVYKELILELNRQPLNKKVLNDFDIHHKENNPLCGDEIELFIKFDADDKVADVGFQGAGCAIAQASTSLLTDYIKGKSRAELKNITAETMTEMLGLPNLNPTRLRCLLLSLKVLQKGLSNETIEQ